MVQQAFKTGLITGVLMSLIAFVMTLWWETWRVIWPLAYIPLFVTGVYAVHRAGSLITSAGRAVLVGGVAGLAGAVVTVVAVTLLSIAGMMVVPYIVPQWSLVPVLSDSPFFVPP